MSSENASVVENVKWFRYNGQTDAERNVTIADSMSKEELLKRMKEKELTIPEADEWEELCLCYDVNGETVFVTIANYTSDVLAERYTVSTNDEIVLTSIKEDTDLVVKYMDEFLRGNVKTQDEYLEKHAAVG